MGDDNKKKYSETTSGNKYSQLFSNIGSKLSINFNFIEFRLGQNLQWNKNGFVAMLANLAFDVVLANFSTLLNECLSGTSIFWFIYLKKYIIKMDQVPVAN